MVNTVGLEKRFEILLIANVKYVVHIYSQCITPYLLARPGAGAGAVPCVQDVVGALFDWT